ASEDLGAPWMQAVPEDAVGAFDRARLQLFDACTLHELREADAPEVRRAERRDVDGEIGIGVRPLDAPVTKAPPSLVPGAERVAHVEDELAALRIRSSPQRCADVHEPEPQPVAEAVADPSRLREHEEQRMVRR